MIKSGKKRFLSNWYGRYSNSFHLVEWFDEEYDWEYDRNMRESGIGFNQIFL